MPLVCLKRVVGLPWRSRNACLKLPTWCVCVIRMWPIGVVVSGWAVRASVRWIMRCFRQYPGTDQRVLAPSCFGVSIGDLGMGRCNSRRYGSPAPGINLQSRATCATRALHGVSKAGLTDVTDGLWGYLSNRDRNRNRGVIPEGGGARGACVRWG